MGPNQVHMHDPAFYDGTYRLDSKHYKDAEMHKTLRGSSSRLGGCNPARDEQLRPRLESLFAKKIIPRLDLMSKERVQQCS